LISLNVGWHKLSLVQSYKLVKSTYVWLVLVPLVVKLFSKLGDEIEIEISGNILHLDLVLPFSWQMFYCSALAFTAGNIIFSLCAPNIIKNYSDYGDFKNKGKLEKDLMSYMRPDILKEKQDNKQFGIQFQSLSFSEKKVNTNAEFDAVNREKELFWETFNNQDTTTKLWRISCGFLYLAGSCCFCVVAAQNIFWVLRYMVTI